MKPFLTLVTVLAALALPVSAHAGLASITFRAVPLSGERTLASTSGKFDLVGVRWHGAGSVRFSVRSAGGRWGPWLDAAPEEEDQPDSSSPEARSTRGWRVGSPTWVGPSKGIRYRISGRVSDLRATFVRSPELKIPLRAIASAGAPPIVPRSAWVADETIVKGTPLYAPAIRFASIHHTAGTNDYSPAQAAAILRGIQSTTSGRTAGTTSATTSSSTGTAPFTRAGPAGSTGTSSVRTSAVSTPARSGSR